MFESIFDWAGEFRTITIYKKEPILNGYSVDYTPHSYIKKEMNELENKFLTIEWSNLSNKEKIHLLMCIIYNEKKIFYKD